VKLRLKFNLILLGVFVVGFVASGYVSYTLLQRHARQEVVRNAELMLETALAIRGYTINQVKPHLELQLMRAFLPQSVPAYAATETLGVLRERYPDFHYKEATLNPTNPRNRASDWEADIVQEFRNRLELKELVGVRETPTGPSLYIARPIQIRQPACLACHSTVDAAPEPMLKLYGTANGFGWRQDEIVGAQVMSVPMSVPFRNAMHVFYTFMGSLFVVLTVTFLTLNVMLGRMIVGPIARMSHAADELSTGNFDLPEFPAQGRDEIAVLGNSFNRMRRSLQKAMQMLKE
jgi:protein-histidine pros-kinase